LIVTTFFFTLFFWETLKTTLIGSHGRTGWELRRLYRFLSCHLFGPENHGQTWKGWERSGEKVLIISDNQDQTWLIITINDTSIGDLPLIITISDTFKNQPKRLDFDNTINLSSLIVILVSDRITQTKTTNLNLVQGKTVDTLLWTKLSFCFGGLITL
jgi:hypothetical protein